MGDWILKGLQSTDASVANSSVWDVVVLCVLTTLIGLPLLVLVHELGHAIAVRLRGLPLTSIVVGDADDLVFRVGAVSVRLGRLLTSGPRGAVGYDATRASAGDLLVIALAGPLANFALAPILAAVALGGLTSETLGAGLALLALESVVLGVSNLIPRGHPDTPGPTSDGRVVQYAWRRRRTPIAEWNDAAPSQPDNAPAKTPSDSSQQGPTPAARSWTFRWPFVAALAAVIVITAVVVGLLALLPIIVIFGGALATGAHRHNTG